ncbi:MAG: FG-GAP-like repeat-containing protein, partial [Anaerolineae bacterium]
NANHWDRQPTDGRQPPVVADLNGDGQLEILLVSHTSVGISVISANGVNSSDVSRAQPPGDGALWSPPVVADIDNDGLFETIVAGSADGTDGKNGQAAVHIWQETGAASPLPWRRPWPMYRHDNRRTGNFCYTDQPPAPPNNVTATPAVNTWSNQTTINASWSGAVGFGCARIRGFSLTWSQSPSTIPDTVVDTFGNTATSPALSTGAWYLHVRARDEWGNWSAAAHFGPFLIDLAAPTTSLHAPGLIASGNIPVNWQGTDAGGSGVVSYTVQARVGSGAWTNWLSGVSATTTNANYPLGALACTTVSFRARARDAAGNIGAFSAPVTTTVGSTNVISGVVTNNIGQPVFNAQVSAPGACAVQPGNPHGQIAAYYPNAGSYNVSVSRSGFASLPTLYARNTGSQDTVVLPPLNNVISRTHFELSGAWMFSANAGYTNQAHSGARGAAITGTGVISQGITTPVPAGAVLSLMTRATNAGAGDTALARLESDSESAQIALPLNPDWTHVWLSAAAFAGQAVTLTIEANDSNPSGLILAVDEVSLGAPAVGVLRIYLPVARR